MRCILASLSPKGVIEAMPLRAELLRLSGWERMNDRIDEGSIPYSGPMGGYSAHSPPLFHPFPHRPFPHRPFPHRPFPY